MYSYSWLINKEIFVQTGGPFTIFAPTNLAFDTVGRDKMLGDVAGLRKVLLRHISRQKLPSLSIPGGISQVDMANTEKVEKYKITLHI